MAFYERTLKCGLCSSSMTIPADDWNQQQALAMEAWSKQHQHEAHPQREGDLPTVLEPNPMFDH